MRHHVAAVGGLQPASNFGEEVKPIHGIFHGGVFREPLHRIAEQLLELGRG